MNKNLFALMDEDTIIYTIGEYKGHVFREYPDGRIKPASNQEKEMVVKMRK